MHTYAANDPVIRIARVCSSVSFLFGVPSQVPANSPSQSLSTLTSPSKSFIRAFRSLRYFTTRDSQCFSRSVIGFRRTVVQLLHLVTHDYAREVNGLQGIPRLGVSGPILPIEEGPCAHRFYERNLHRGPVGGTRDLLGLVM